MAVKKDLSIIDLKGEVFNIIRFYSDEIRYLLDYAHELKANRSRESLIIYLGEKYSYYL